MDGHSGQRFGCRIVVAVIGLLLRILRGLLLCITHGLPGTTYTAGMSQLEHLLSVLSAQNSFIRT